MITNGTKCGIVLLMLVSTMASSADPKKEQKQPFLKPAVPAKHWYSCVTELFADAKPTGTAGLKDQNGQPEMLIYGTPLADDHKIVRNPKYSGPYRYWDDIFPSTPIQSTNNPANLPKMD